MKHNPLSTKEWINKLKITSNRVKLWYLLICPQNHMILVFNFTWKFSIQSNSNQNEDPCKTPDSKKKAMIIFPQSLCVCTCKSGISTCFGNSHKFWMIRLNESKRMKNCLENRRSIVVCCFIITNKDTDNVTEWANSFCSCVYKYTKHVDK